MQMAEKAARAAAEKRMQKQVDKNPSAAEVGKIISSINLSHQICSARVGKWSEPITRPISLVGPHPEMRNRE